MREAILSAKGHVPLGQSWRSWIMQAHWHSGLNALLLYKDVLAGLVVPGMQILHGGCGHDMHDVSRPFIQSCTVVGVDLDPRVAPLFHSEFHLASLAAMPFDDDRFDVICLDYVLEHIEDPPAVFRELKRVLKPGGHILILTPNLYSYKSLLAYCTPYAFHLRMGRIRYGRGHEADMYPTYFRCNTLSRFERLARANDLAIRRVSFVTNGPTWFEKVPLLFELFHLYHLAIERWDFARWLRCAMIVQLRK